MSRLRRVKNTSGFVYRQTLQYRIVDGIKRIWCWIAGHGEVEIYSWISYCERCCQTFDPTEEDEEDEIVP